MVLPGKGVIFFGIAIFIGLTFGVYFYTIGADFFLLLFNPSMENLSRLTFDSGKLVAATQWIIKNAVIGLQGEQPSPLYTDFLIRAILAGLLLTLLLVIGVYIGLKRTILTAFGKTFTGKIGILLASLAIVGGSQVFFTLAMTGQFVWPFEGLFVVQQNGDIIARAILESGKELGKDSLFEFTGGAI